MSEREQPDPGEGWRIATGDDCKDLRCEIIDKETGRWGRRHPANRGLPFRSPEVYRIPIDAPQPDLVNSPQPDLVNAPPHYRQGGIECIDAIRAALTDEEFRGFCKGNVIKYTWRERHKAGDADLSKAGDYLNWTKQTNEATK
jgi:hypothetical protein